MSQLPPEASDIPDEDQDSPEVSQEVLSLAFSFIRPYAGYFDVKGHKAQTERGVVDNWLHALRRYPHKHFTLEDRRNKQDPPDIVLIHDQERIGIEVTELVDGASISAVAKAEKEKRATNQYPKEYEEKESLDLIKDRILKKAAKNFHDEPYTSKILLMHTDEPSIYGGEFLSRIPPIQQSFFNEVWIVTPPAPNLSGRDPENPNCRIYEIKNG
jgi:hypothetical protein